MNTKNAMTLRRIFSALTISGLLLGASVVTFAQDAPNDDAPHKERAQKDGKQSKKGDRKDRKERKGKKGKRGKKGARMFKQLNLDEQQVAQMKELRGASKLERRAIIEQAGDDRQAARPQLKAHRLASKQKMLAILTSEQQQQLEQLRKERKERRAERAERGDRTGGPRHERGSKGPF